MIAAGRGAASEPERAFKLCRVRPARERAADRARHGARRCGGAAHRRRRLPRWWRRVLHAGRLGPRARARARDRRERPACERALHARVQARQRPGLRRGRARGRAPRSARRPDLRAVRPVVQCTVVPAGVRRARAADRTAGDITIGAAVTGAAATAPGSGGGTLGCDGNSGQYKEREREDRGLHGMS